jgi:hypothetical protein
MSRSLTPIAALAALISFAAGCDSLRPVDRKRPVKGPSTARAQAQAKGKPRIASAQPKYDFGKVEEGTKVEHVFTVKNEGDGVLQIKRASGG